MAKMTDKPSYIQPRAEPVPSNNMMGRATPVTIGKLPETKTTGIKMRGTGAATKGTMSRGPMA